MQFDVQSLGFEAAPRGRSGYGRQIGFLDLLDQDESMGSRRECGDTSAYQGFGPGIGIPDGGSVRKHGRHVHLGSPRSAYGDYYLVGDPVFFISALEGVGTVGNFGMAPSSYGNMLIPELAYLLPMRKYILIELIPVHGRARPLLGIRAGISEGPRHLVSIERFHPARQQKKRRAGLN
ncbi:hypothetical protein D1872_248820 [compost metagenome]